MYILPDALVPNILLDIENDLGLYPPGWVVRLYTNNLIPTKTNVLADFTEATNVEVPGYAVAAPTWDGFPFRMPLGSWQDNAPPVQFKATGAPPSPQIVYGWFATDAAKLVLLGSGAFLAPFTFSLNGDGFQLEPELNVLQGSGNTETVTLDMVGPT